jgi:hypothetical protein
VGLAALSNTRIKKVPAKRALGIALAPVIHVELSEMRIIMTQRELEKRLRDYEEYGEDAVEITTVGKGKYALLISLGNGQEVIPIEIEPELTSRR